MKPDSPIRKIGLALQGGGSSGAFTAGALDTLLLDPSIETTHITGTSAGALNGYIVTQAINKYGYGIDGRRIARKRLKHVWESLTVPYKHNEYQSIYFDFLRSTMPVFDRMMKNGFSRMLERNLNNILINPNALQQGTPIHLTINAVDDSGQQKLFMGDELNARSVLASAALPGFINPVRIGDTYYKDGACAGGANPPIESLLSLPHDLDAVICIMTNIPEHPIQSRLQSDLIRDDLKKTEGLILHQAFNEIAYHLEHVKTPMHVIMPNIDQPWSARDKQDISYSTFKERRWMGKKVMVNFLRNYSSSLHQESSMSVHELKKHAMGLRNVAA